MTSPSEMMPTRIAGIVTLRWPDGPNHFLAVAINYLFQNRPGWDPKTPRSAKHW